MAMRRPITSSKISVQERDYSRDHSRSLQNGLGYDDNDEEKKDAVGTRIFLYILRQML